MPFLSLIRHWLQLSLDSTEDKCSLGSEAEHRAEGVPPCPGHLAGLSWKVPKPE